MGLTEFTAVSDDKFTHSPTEFDLAISLLKELTSYHLTNKLQIS